MSHNTDTAEKETDGEDEEDVDTVSINDFGLLIFVFESLLIVLIECQGD